MRDPRIDNLTAAYGAMATGARYRAGAPSDGVTGAITVPLDELDLDAEAVKYARHWLAEEDTDRFWIGCTDFSTARATVYAIEAARNLCSGFFGIRTAQRLLQMAVDELAIDRIEREARFAELMEGRR